MSLQFHKWLQQRLVVHGYKLAADGIIGPVTRGALAGFQLENGLKITSSATPETVTALRLSVSGSDSGAAKVLVRPPWLVEAERRMGLHEVRDYSTLAKWLRLDGPTLGDPRKLPWCGDFIETAVRLTLPEEPVPTNPYLARNWMKFGKSTKGREGAIAVFWRGSRTGTSGHVAFYVGEDASAYHVLGGNQANAVTVTRIAKTRLLGFRWPASLDLDTIAVARAANGALSTNEA